MLKKRQRLSRTEFSHLLTHGRRVHGESLTVVYLESRDATATRGTRCGVVVSKKTAKRATARNTLRRRIYAALGVLLDLKRDRMLAVLTRPAALTRTPEALTNELRSLLERTNLHSGTNTGSART